MNAAIDVATLDAWRKEGKPHLLIDVREQDEWDTARIDGAKLIPLRGLPARLEELPKDEVIVVHCHHGGRSAQAVQFLRARGYAGATNLTGGIDAWSRATCASSAIVIRSRKRRPARSLITSRSHVVVADAARPSAASRTRRG